MSSCKSCAAALILIWTRVRLKGSTYIYLLFFWSCFGHQLILSVVYIVFDRVIYDTDRNPVIHPLLVNNKSQRVLGHLQASSENKGFCHFMVFATSILQQIPNMLSTLSPCFCQKSIRKEVTHPRNLIAISVYLFLKVESHKLVFSLFLLQSFQFAEHFQLKSFANIGFLAFAPVYLFVEILTLKGPDSIQVGCCWLASPLESTSPRCPARCLQAILFWFDFEYIPWF